MTDLPFRFVATDDDAGRIDAALVRRFPGTSRKRVAALFDDRCVRVGGRLAKKGDLVNAGDEVELQRLPATDEDFRPTPDQTAADGLEFIFQSDDYVAINKPAGMRSQPLKVGELGTAASAIAARFPECAAVGGDPRDGGLVHRLDTGTTGVLIAARHQTAWQQLRDAFASHRVQKTYIAFVERMPVSRSIDVPLLQRGNRSVVDHAEGLSASTQVIEAVQVQDGVLLRVEARTGRMHQVRAHLAAVDAPIIGDTLYGGRTDDGFTGFFLHAASLRAELTQPLALAARMPADRLARLRAAGAPASWLA